MRSLPSCCRARTRLSAWGFSACSVLLLTQKRRPSPSTLAPARGVQRRQVDAPVHPKPGRGLRPWPTREPRVVPEGRQEGTDSCHRPHAKRTGEAGTGVPGVEAIGRTPPRHASATASGPPIGGAGGRADPPAPCGGTCKQPQARCLWWALRAEDGSSHTGVIQTGGRGPSCGVLAPRTYRV